MNILARRPKPTTPPIEELSPRAAMIEERTKNNAEILKDERETRQLDQLAKDKQVEADTARTDAIRFSKLRQFRIAPLVRRNAELARQIVAGAPPCYDAAIADLEEQIHAALKQEKCTMFNDETNERMYRTNRPSVNRFVPAARAAQAELRNMKEQPLDDDAAAAAVARIVRRLPKLNLELVELKG